MDIYINISALYSPLLWVGYMFRSVTPWIEHLCSLSKHDKCHTPFHVPFKVHGDMLWIALHLHFVDFTHSIKRVVCNKSEHS